MKKYSQILYGLQCNFYLRRNLYKALGTGFVKSKDKCKRLTI